MYQLIIVIHVLLGLGIVGLVMLQQGKGADAGATFGAGASASVFGAQGASSFLSRSTATLAGLFFVTSLSLAVINSHKETTTDLMSTNDSTLPPVDNIQKSVVPSVVTEKVEVTAPKAVEKPTVEITPTLTTPALKIDEAKPETVKTETPAIKNEELKPTTATSAEKPETVKAVEHENKSNKKATHEDKHEKKSEKHTSEKRSDDKHSEKHSEKHKDDKHSEKDKDKKKHSEDKPEKKAKKTEHD